ncbi:MAG: hypothetical protein KKE01_02005, partial [Candidatus Omnitrophica bacterium]|nr:hypothetical protein [Candidatus Omnitrophota bacterium]
LFQPSCFAATYHITNVDELQAMQNDLYGDYILDNDIDASETQTWNGGKGFIPIGGNGSFYGSLDGKNYTIQNLYISNQRLYFHTGLFRWNKSSAKITNVHLENVNITGRSNQAPTGALVGFNENGTIENCSIVGGGITNTGGAFTREVGGLVGLSQGGLINKCFVEGATVRINVSGSGPYAGGLVGRLTIGAQITNSYSTANVVGYRVGGLVGKAELAALVENTYAAGAVAGSQSAGGLIGYTSGATISYSYWDIETSGQSSSAGGEGKTTAQMMQQATFFNWDFNTIWIIDEGTSYPYFGSGASFIDIGLRVYDGTDTVKIACEPDDNVTSPLRIAKDEKVFGIALVAMDDPNATKIRIKTSSGVMALRRY